MIKHAYLIEARGHPGHDVIRNFYQSKNLKDGKIYNRQFRCVGEDEWITKTVKDKDGNEKEQEGWKGGDGENTVNLQQVIQGTYSTMVGKFPILRTAGHKFTPGVATMWTRGEFGQMFEDPIFNTFNTVLEMIVEFHKNDYDGYLRRIRKEKKETILIDNDTPTAEELIDRFSQAREENIQATKDRINAKEYENTKYFIRPITEYDDLLRYEDFCYSENVWCLMNGEQAWKHYTSNGMYQFYLVLDKRLCNENGDPILENKNIIPAEQGEGHPNDEYGLSMMGIIVDEDGELAYCTSRWNHAGKGDDHTMNAEEISNTLGVNFYQTFKPNHKFQDAVEKAINIYRENSSLEGFNEYRKSGIDGLVVVTLSKKQNIFNTKTYKIISNIWFNYVDVFKEGLIIIELGNKGRNFMNADGKILSDIWFESSTPFNEGFSNISIKDKGYNYINTNGEFLSDIWFDFAFRFSNGIGKILLKDKGYNYINSNGDFLSKIWFKDMHSFIDGVSVVSIDSKGYNIINKNFELLSDIWFDVISDFINGIGKVYKKNKGYNFINTNGELLSNIWIDRIYDFKNNIALIYVYSKDYNYINTNGEIISDIWFDFAENFKDGMAIVKLDDKGWNFINSNGEILSDIWFDNVNLFKDGIARVKLNDKGWNFINTNGEIISDIWFEDTRTFFSDFAIVYLKNRKNELFKIDRYGNLYDYNNNNLIHKGILAEENGEQIANESLRRKYAKELNEILDLNKRIKILYE